MELKIIDTLLPGGSHLESRLRAELGSADGIRLELRGPDGLPVESDGYRATAFDPTVLVAIVTAAGSALAVLIAGLLRILEQRSPQGRILVEGDGWRVEVPAGTSLEDIRALVDETKAKHAKRLVIADEGAP